MKEKKKMRTKMIEIVNRLSRGRRRHQAISAVCRELRVSPRWVYLVMAGNPVNVHIARSIEMLHQRVIEEGEWIE